MRLLLAWGVLHVLVGRQGVLNHDWWWWPLTPGLVMAAALMMDRVCAAVERGRARLVPRTSAGVAVLLVAFGVVTTRGEFHSLLTPRIFNGGITQYSIVDYGNAIRAAAPPGKAVIIADTEATVSLWYYGDRPLMLALDDTDLWDVPGILRRIDNPERTDLPFDYSEKPWREAPAAFIMPAVYGDQLKQFVADLRATFEPLALPDGLNEKFLAFDLRRRIDGNVGSEAGQALSAQQSAANK